MAVVGLWSVYMYAQDTGQPYKMKLSPALQSFSARAVLHETLSRFLLQCTDTGFLSRIPVAARDSIYIQYRYGNSWIIGTWPSVLQRWLLPQASVVFADRADRQPKEEVSIAGFDYTANGVNRVHRLYPAVDGRQTVVSVKENRPDTADIDFTGRYIPATMASSSLSSHATIMGTIIAGGGNSFYTGRGVAPGAGLSSSSFAVLLPDSDVLYRRYGISVQNHSYGTGIENYYGADAAAYDASVLNNPSLVHVFSAGNSGDQVPGAGTYKGIAGLANLTGSFKMAKNIITVGSTDSFYTIPLLSSKGPAYDGRVKPELVAYGEDGSSGAAALVSGTALLLQQVYKEQHGAALPDAALVKAVLLNSATDAGNPGIDFSTGYGRLDALRAVREMQAAHYMTGTVSQAVVKSFTLTVPANAQNLKILLCWTDPPATANAAKALVNDLDLRVQHSASGGSWQPWVLSAAAVKDSLLAAPQRKNDTLNTVEQVTIGNPLPGDYTITVSGSHITAGAQAFYIACQWDSSGTFEWSYPSAGDNLLPGQANQLRWQSNIAGNGTLEWSYAGSSSWQPLQAGVAAAGGGSRWTTPDTSTVLLLRMRFGGTEYRSDTFTVSPKPLAGVGFNCPDSFLLYWDKNRAATGYVLYRLGAQYMETLKTVTD
ncbi:MAG: S8 family serine peptidase, partial [Bacteroidetes bacterium]|nr:S8 family serine peptidase [Bacteroidota bacterium]